LRHPLPAESKRRTRFYDKGERRHKHVATGNEPQFVFDSDNPRKVVGKCPSTIEDEVRDALLERAVPLENVDRELRPPKKVYAVYKGAIYEAQTSDHGTTYHAYPHKGKLSDGIVRLLEAMADQDDCRDAFDAWRKKHIKRHGR
jgi:hypothetical protein